MCKISDVEAKDKFVPSVGKRGIYTSIDPLLNTLTRREACVGIDYNGLNFQGYLYIANIYASNKMHERIEMRKAMVQCLPREANENLEEIGTW